MYFQNHHERALCVMKGMGYITKPISTSRFSRRVHALAAAVAAAGWLEYILELLGALFAKGEAFIVDSMPVPVCKYVRAWRCRKINGSLPSARAYFGKCAAKKWRFFGWRLHLMHLICTPSGVPPSGVPVAFQMLPGSWHDLTPIYELTFGLPKGAAVYADKGYISALVKRTLRPTAKREGVYLVAWHNWHKKNMKKPNTFL